MPRRIDAAHGPPGSSTAAETFDPAVIKQFRDLLSTDRLSLREAADLVDRSTPLRRAVMKAVTSVEVGWSQPVEGTLHALAILGTRRLQRVANQLAAATSIDNGAKPQALQTRKH